MVVGWTPTSLAMRRQLQCVASAGFSSRVLRTISASSSGVILRGRPERGRSSSSSSTPPASYRSSHCVTVGLDTPTSRQIADPDRPSAEQRTMLALSTTRCGVVRLFTNRSKRLRSPRRNRILRTGSPMRGIYRMYLLAKDFCYTTLGSNERGVPDPSDCARPNLSMVGWDGFSDGCGFSDGYRFSDCYRAEGPTPLPGTGTCREWSRAAACTRTCPFPGHTAKRRPGSGDPARGRGRTT